VRHKGFIEFRSTDSQPARSLLAPAALIKGLFYESDCLEAAWDVVKSWTFDECVDLAADATRRALGARMRRIDLREIAAELGKVAAEGLRRQQGRDERGRDETVYLEPCLETIASGTTPAELVARSWPGEWNLDPRALVAGTRLLDELP
jgi:glutamate--cysteine ligase